MRNRPIRALIVDDEALARRFIRRMLKDDRDFEIVGECSNGKETVAMIRRENPDIVFLDVQMPEMDGFEATAIIREREKKVGGRIPIIAMTAHAMKGDEERCLAAGMDGYISKPIHSETLISAIHRCLELPFDPKQVEREIPQDALNRV